MRVFGRDLIRGGHYGQRSCEPHLKAEHMAAPTNAAKREKSAANTEPSTHRTFPTSRRLSGMSAAEPGCVKTRMLRVAGRDRSVLGSRSYARIASINPRTP